MMTWGRHALHAIDGWMSDAGRLEPSKRGRDLARLQTKVIRRLFLPPQASLLRSLRTHALSGI